MLVGLWRHHVPVDLILFADPGAEQPHTKDKTCSVRGTFFTMEKVPLHYVLGRYNPAVGEEHYGVRGIVPFFCEDKELAGYYLNEVRTMWDVEMGEEQDLSM